MSEIEKVCANCRHRNCSALDYPCKDCISTSKVIGIPPFISHTMWESKEEDNDLEKIDKMLKFIRENGIYGIYPKLPVYSDTVFKTENDCKIDHIDKRVEDIQHNVLVYGNDAVSKLIGLSDKLNALYIDLDKELQSLDTRIDGLESMLKDIQKTLNDQPVIGDIHRVESKLDGIDIKQVVVDERPTEKELKEAHERLKKMTKNEPRFKDGDLVKISGERSKNKVWIVRTSEFNCALSCWTYLLMDVDDHDILAHETEYRLVKYESKFRVGDLVKYKTGSVPYFVTDVKESNCKYFYDLERRFSNNKRNYKIAGILESRLEEVK